MKLQINSDGTMFVDGGASDLAEFVRAMSTTPTMVVPATSSTMVVPVAPKPVRPKLAPLPVRLIGDKAEDKLLAAMSEEVGATTTALALRTGFSVQQTENLLWRLLASGAVQSDCGDTPEWVRIVRVKRADSAPTPKNSSTGKPASSTNKPADGGSTRAKRGSNVAFVKQLCVDWMRRADILAAVSEAGLNAVSVSAELKNMVRSGALECRVNQRYNEYRAKS